MPGSLPKLPNARLLDRSSFGRNWGERLRPLLSSEDWVRRSALCDPQSPEYVLARPDYYCLYPITVFTARNRS